MEQLQWLLDLQQNISGPAMEAAQGLEKLAKAFGGADKATTKTEKDINKASEGMKKAKEGAGALAVELGKVNKAGIGIDLEKLFSGETAGLFSLNIIEGARFLMEAGKVFADFIKEAVKGIYDVSKEMINAAAGQERLELSYRLLLGKKGGAEALADISRFANKTGYDDGDIAKALRPVVQAGIKPGTELRSVFALAGDLEAKLGGGMGTISNVLQAITDIKLRGQVESRRLTQLGVSAPDFYNILGKSLHVSPAQAEKLAAAGGINYTRILNAMIETVEKQQGAKLGTATEAVSKTAEARLDRLRQLPENYFKQLADTPAFTQFSDRLDQIFKRLNPDTPEGKQITEGISKFFDKVIDLFDKLASPEGVKQVTQALEGLLDVMKDIVEALGHFVHEGHVGAASLRDLTGNATNEDKDFLKRESLKRQSYLFRYFGGDQNDVNKQAKALGIAPEVFNQAVTAYKQGKDVGDKYIDGVKNGLDSHSPSKKMIALGKSALDGFSIGLGDGVDMDMSLPAVKTPTKGSIGSTINLGGINLDIKVEGSGNGDPKEVGSAVYEEIEAKLPGVIALLLERLASEQGN